MRSELVDEVVHVNKQQVDVLNLFFSLTRLWALKCRAKNIKKTDGHVSIFVSTGQKVNQLTAVFRLRIDPGFFADPDLGY